MVFTLKQIQFFSCISCMLRELCIISWLHISFFSLSEIKISDQNLLVAERSIPRSLGDLKLPIVNLSKYFSVNIFVTNGTSFH